MFILREEILSFATRQKEKLASHPNKLAQNLLGVKIPESLKRTHLLELY